ncbi:MAG: stage II sporulation protein M [Gammaproteobacteria bacterium]|nr:stage II sporulation protein M [Gammaproteobacteria bacterium]
MKQYAFEQQNAALWSRYETLTKDLNSNKSSLNALQRYELPALYRRICQHYAIAQQRHYSLHLINQLHQQVLAGHQLLYEHKVSWLWRMLSFIWVGFPNQIRRHWKVFWLATLLFYLPAFAFGIACYFDSEMIYQIMPDHSVADMEYMYDPGNDNVGRKAERQADTDIMMFGYYIFNNISIGFRAYALGILLGIGTIFNMIYNGLFVGGVAGHLSQLGFTQTFWPFVSGHSAFELTAICICGAAGLCLARAIVAPGRRRRIDALRIAGIDSIQMVIGAALMLVIAAFIEAFWSSSNLLPIPVKYTVGAFFWLIVLLYLWRAGRNLEDGASDGD